MKKVSIFLVILVFVAGCYFFYKIKNSPNENTTFNWMLNDKASYFLSNETVSFFGNNNISKYSLNITGILNLKVLKIKDFPTVVFQLTNLNVLSNSSEDNLLKDLYSNPVVIEFNKNGSFKSFYFINNLPDEDKEMIKQFYYALEIILPNNENKKYVAKQTDQMGTYVAKYARNGHKGLKKKIKYIDTNESVIKNNIKIIQSNFNFEIDKNSSWLNKLFGEEEIRFKMGDTESSFFTNAKNIVSLKKSQNIYESDIWEYDENFSNIKRVSIKKSVREIKKEKYMDSILTKNKFELKNILMLLNNDNNMNSDLFLRYFELNPSKIKQIKFFLKENQYSPELVSKIFLMLSILGDDNAQNLLVDIWEDNTFSDAERISAVSALMNLKNRPVDNLFDKLTSGLSYVKVGEKSSALYSTPILVCGIIIKNIKGRFPQAARDYNDNLVSLLKSSEEPAQVNILLLSLGNSRIPSNIDIILDYLNSNDPRIFDTAVFVAGKYSSTEIAISLIEKMEDDNINSNQKVNILRSLYNQPLSNEQIKKMESILLDSKDISVRAGIIKILGKNKSLDHEGINKVLKEAYKNETSSENMKLIIKTFDK
jgi:HEAT repeat protein